MQKFTLILLCLITSSILADQPTVIPESSVHLKQKKDEDVTQTSSITRKEIKNSPVVWLSDLLRQEQSVLRIANNTVDSSQMAISMRGFGQNAYANSLIVVDGFPMVNMSTLTPAFNSIALTDIERIDISPSSAGTVWGNQAIGGVLDITTRHPAKPMADFVMGYGSQNHSIYNVLLGDKLDNGFFFKVSGFANHTDNYRQSNHQDDQSIFAQTGFDYKNGSITLQTQQYDSSNQLPGMLFQQEYDTDPYQAVTFKDYAHVQGHVYQIIQSQNLGNSWVWETRASHNDIQRDGIFGTPYMHSDMADMINPKLTGDILNTHILLGYVGQKDAFDANTSNPQSVSTWQNDFYEQNIIPLTKKLDFTLGGRMAWETENISQNFGGEASDLSSRVFVSEEAFTYHLKPEWDMFIKRDGNFRFPKANEMLGLPSSATPLLTQTGISYEAGTKWHTNRQTAQFSLYQLDLNNELAFDPTLTAAAPFGTWSNLPETRRQGVTVSETYQLIEPITLQGQFNYVDPRFVEGMYKNNQIGGVPDITGNLGIMYRFKQNWSIHYDAVYIGSRYASSDSGNVTPRQSAYWLSDTGLQFLHKSFQINFEVQNLFNQKYPIVAVFKPDTQSNIYYAGAGRNFLTTFKLSL